MEEYEQYDGLGLAALVRQGEVCPEELLEAAIARIEAHNPWLNAVVTPMFDEARAALRAGLPSGPFQGVPFLLKDLALAAVPGVRTRQARARPCFRILSPGTKRRSLPATGGPVWSLSARRRRRSWDWHRRLSRGSTG